METVKSKHFELNQIGQGIYAAIVSPNGGGMGNAGIVDLGGHTLIFDTFNTPQAAKDLKKAAEALTGNPITYVVNSHYHGDHIRGNQVFEHSEIISTERTMELMRDKLPERMERQRANIQEIADYIASLEEQLKNEQNPEKKQELINNLGSINEFYKSVPITKLVLSAKTFQDEMEIGGSKRSVRLITYGGGHTESDAFLYIPDAGIVFTADLLTIHTHPFIGDGNPKEFIRILNKMQLLDADVFVPGHGPVGRKEDLSILQRYLHDLLQVEVSDSESDLEIPEAYRSWNASGMYKNNVNKILQQRKETVEK